MINNKYIDCVNKSKYKNFTIPLYDRQVDDIVTAFLFNRARDKKISG